MIRRGLMASSLAALLVWAWCYPRGREAIPDGRQVVRFWHFWGGEEGRTVADIVRRFNASQSQFWVESVAMPGANLDVKLFLAVTGRDPPDLVNQDDPILADWAMRRAIVPIGQIAAPSELQALRDWLFPAAWQLGCVAEVPFAVCNGLDVRALYYNATLLQQHGLSVPRTITELDRAAEALVDRVRDSERIGPDSYRRLGFFPNPRNLWSWGIVFGGDFFDERQFQPTADDRAIAAALEWMASYGRRFGTAAAAFRQRDQSLPGKAFPLLADRYAMIVDGQWRCRDIARWQSQPQTTAAPIAQFGVASLPVPPGGRTDAGWINGNFFVIPQGASNTPGAWAFIRFWCGFGGGERQAARTCAKGYWIPVSQAVVDQKPFQEFLRANPLFGEFVRLAGSPHQVPRPNIPSAVFYDREIIHAASEAIFRPHERSSQDVLRAARRRMDQQLRTSGESWHRFLNGLSTPSHPAQGPVPW